MGHKKWGREVDRHDTIGGLRTPIPSLRAAECPRRLRSATAAGVTKKSAGFARLLSRGGKHSTQHANYFCNAPLQGCVECAVGSPHQTPLKGGYMVGLPTTPWSPTTCPSIMSVSLLQGCTTVHLIICEISKPLHGQAAWKICEIRVICERNIPSAWRREVTSRHVWRLYVRREPHTRTERSTTWMTFGAAARRVGCCRAEGGNSGKGDARTEVM